MSDAAMMTEPQREYWVSGKLKTVATGLTGIIAVLVALKAISHGGAHDVTINDHVYRMVIFASMTIWISLTIGIRKRGIAAMFVLAFASFVELFVLPSRGDQMGTLASSNLGIVFAYSGLQLYWFKVIRPLRANANAASVEQTAQ